MIVQTIACCMYAPGSYDTLLPGLDLEGPMSDLRDAILATRGKRRNEFDQITIVRWIHQYSAGGMTTEHTIAMTRVTEAWWAMPDKMRDRARELSDTIRQSP